MRVLNYTGFRFGNVLETALFAVDYLGYLANTECNSQAPAGNPYGTTVPIDSRLGEMLEVRIKTSPPIYYAIGQWTHCILPVAFSKPDRVTGEVAVSIEVYAKDPRK